MRVPTRPARKLTPAQLALRRATAGKLEAEFDAELRRRGLREHIHYERQFRFDKHRIRDDSPGSKPREFPADFWIVGTNLLIECDGIVWKPTVISQKGKGGHENGAGVERGAVKRNLAWRRGYEVLTCVNKRTSEASPQRVADLVADVVKSQTK